MSPTGFRRIERCRLYYFINNHSLVTNSDLLLKCLPLQNVRLTDQVKSCILTPKSAHSKHTKECVQIAISRWAGACVRGDCKLDIHTVTEMEFSVEVIISLLSEYWFVVGLLVAGKTISRDGLSYWKYILKHA